jgi:23S rRNA pseudouridine1911/1915/1917 synthase
MEKNHYTYEPELTARQTVEKVLIRDYGYSSRLLRRIKRRGRVTINGRECWLVDEMAPGDRIDVIMPGEAIDCEAVEGPLEILYEDDEILAVNKDADCVTHPTKSHQLDTLANRVAWYWQREGQAAKVRFINRLDRDTTGIVVIAKNNYVHHFVQSERKCDKVVKKYLAFVHGTPPQRAGVIEAPIARTEEDGILRDVIPGGKLCRTRYEVLEDYGEASLLRLVIETGRTHQIRVHLKYLGCPIIGDPLYGDARLLDYGMTRQALHSAEMILTLPKAGRVHLRAPLKTDMQTLWNTMKQISEGEK